MDGEAASANQRLGVARNDALQGAMLAFQHSMDHSPNVNPRSSVATAAMASDRHTLGRQRAGSDAPEVGSVKDKIGRWAKPPSPPVSTLSSLRGRASAASLSSTSTSQIAARLAASRSPGRDTSVPSTTARLGAGASAARSASRVPPLPASLRSIHDRDIYLGRMLHESGLKSDSDLPIYKRSPSQQSRSTLDDQDSRGPSPHPSLESLNPSMPSDESKPRLPPRVPPPRGSIRNHGFITTPLRPSTPSEASMSNHSRTTSSSSLIDDSLGMTEESLSNAIIASSLASSRASPSPNPPPPLPPHRRGARAILHLTHHHHKTDLSRTPSPPKSMPMTLRGMPKPTDADHRKHRNPLHKHPHKHREGDRKRWRTEVTERERKRYEGVWASNKGLLIPPDSDGSESWPPHASEMVLNLVVREIWSRSRLSEAILGQVWDLVDHQNNGLLLREEFVVGMWLIDQFLKGHKIPVKVQDSVWDSVRHVVGLKVPLGKGKAHT
ncbi:hypothetical protein DTO013E5_648 [Penicillium roqueforti]|uniref:EPS15 homology (EH) n=1 Tax=Penicillium roqueforti (strain FM164) TaxID=1365484 RepID=W6Q419_PENRF|nr:uncharacterized protein LCP9604111_302 [Penicillium roqueforti]CDM30706.1 EPS15 homology (EH) [Penicillium roqueforti FM164]KAF9252776.1 hypothetical protein LCP9604111_302 [Penicillium roqueforti]KAI1838480.1 hypothetical protein CBS147337_205 [Penicillium roqueforti]KAI2680602.1 hypothetical protein CBS147355_3582 [Penicillium roqueforti]KAI2691009.1 hypothetical protein LCP963914a_1210 [Penicillium roqueforti]